MPSQRALLVTRPGAPVTLGTRAIPTPGPNQVLVKVSIAGLNPHDRLIRDFAYFVGEDNLPTPIGIDIVGTVHELGPYSGDGARFDIGDVVFGNGDPASPDQNATQEYALLDVNFMARVPRGVSGDEAATLTLNTLTMYIALFGDGALGIPSPLEVGGKGYDYAKVAVAIVGGGSNCGKFAIQLAKWAGIGTIIATASTAGGKEELLKEIGATHVVERSRSDDEVEKEVRGIVGDELVYVIDAVNIKDQTLAVRLLSNSKKGTMVPLVHRGAIDKSKIGRKEKGYDLETFVARPVVMRDFAARFWRELPGLIEKGTLRSNQYAVIQGLDAEKVNEAVDAYRDDNFGNYPTKPHVHIG